MRLLLPISIAILSLNTPTWAMSKAKKVDRGGESCTEWCTSEGKKTLKLDNLMDSVKPVVNFRAKIDLSSNEEYNNACASEGYAQKPGNVYWCEEYCQAGGLFSTFKGRQEKVKQFLQQRKIDCSLLKKR